MASYLLRGRKTIAYVILAGFLFLPPAISVFAQLNNNAPSTTPGSSAADAGALNRDKTAPSFVSISATSSEPTTMTVFWVTDEPATGVVEYGPTTAYGNFSETTGLALEQDQFIVELFPGTTYHYRIIATDEAGNVGYSEDRTLTTAEGPEIGDVQPPNITYFGFSDITATSAKVIVDTDEETTARLEYGLAPGETLVTVPSSDAELAIAHVFLLSDLEADTTYHVRVTAEDGMGNSTTSPEETLVTAAPIVVEPLPVPLPEAAATSGPPVVPKPPTPGPPALTILEHDVSDITTSTVLLTWATSRPAFATIYYGTTPAYGQSVSVTDIRSSHALVLTGLLSDTTYYYEIVTESANGDQAIVEQQEFTTLEVIPPGPNLIISNVNVPDVSQTEATIYWNTNLPADSQVEYGLTTNYNHTTSLDTNLTTVHQVRLTGLAPGETYHYRVISKTQDGEVALYEDRTFSTLEVATAPPPSSLWTHTPVLSSVVVSDLRVIHESPTTITVAWTAPVVADVVVDEYSYDMRYSEGAIAGHDFSLLAKGQEILFRPEDHETDGHTVTFTYIGLSPSTQYHFALRIHEPHGQVSHVSKEVIGTTHHAPEDPNDPEAPTGPPPTPPQLITIRAMDSQVAFLWQHSSLLPVEKTVIVRKQGTYPSSPFDGEVVYEGDGSTFTDTGLQNGHVYLYSLFHLGPYGHFSAPLKVMAIPQEEVTQISLESRPVHHLTPIYLFTEELEYGDRGTDVHNLQTLLAAYPDLYPEGLVTGYFGPLTRAAVRRFQEKFGLEVTGRLDVATRQQLEVFSAR